MDLIVQKIGIIKNEMTHLWNALIVVIGGTLGLFLVPYSLKTLSLIIIGIVMFFLLVNAYILRRNILFELLSQMNKEETWTVH